MHPSPISDTTSPSLPRLRWSTVLSSSLAYTTGRVYYTIALQAFQLLCENERIVRRCLVRGGRWLVRPGRQALRTGGLQGRSPGLFLSAGNGRDARSSVLPGAGLARGAGRATRGHLLSGGLRTG